MLRVLGPKLLLLDLPTSLVERSAALATELKRDAISLALELQNYLQQNSRRPDIKLSSNFVRARGGVPSSEAVKLAPLALAGALGATLVDQRSRLQ